MSSTAGMTWSLVDGKRKYTRVVPRQASVQYHSSGYRLLLVENHPRADKSGRVLEHILIAERALGRFLPDKAEIHHFNKIRSDNSNQNLVICEDRAYHQLLHRRQRIKHLGGNPDTDRICVACQALKTITEFGSDANRSDAIRASCRTCTNRQNRQARARQ